MGFTEGSKWQEEMENKRTETERRKKAVLPPLPEPKPKQVVKPSRSQIVTEGDIKFMAALMAFSDVYEISIQLWPVQKVIYIAKDGIDLFEVGRYEFSDAAKSALKYLYRICNTPESERVEL